MGYSESTDTILTELFLSENFPVIDFWPGRLIREICFDGVGRDDMHLLGLFWLLRHL